MSRVIQVEHHGHLAVVTLNDPKTLNSLSLEGIQQLLQEWSTLATHGGVRAVLVTGAGRAFCSGWQLGDGELPGIAGESFGVRQSHLMEEYFNPVIEAMHTLPVPIVAAVNGVCAGAGVSIALAADIVLASTEASFVLTFAPKLGLVPDLGASWKLPRLLGWARAQAVTMLGERINAEQAERWGLIWRAVPGEALMAQAQDVAMRLAAAPPGVCREIRHLYERAQLNALVPQMDLERQRQRELLDRPSFQEGLRAFQEKRAPKFHPD